MCSGDFKQLLPVVKRGNEADIYNACIKESYLWRKFTKFNLKRNMRVQEEGNENSQFLIKIGEDKIEKNENGEIALPADMIIPAISLDECIEYIYPFFDQSRIIFADNCMLVPFNETVRAINHRCIEKFKRRNEKILFLQLCLYWNRGHTLSYGIFRLA